jgi:hypothetical protein
LVWRLSYGYANFSDPGSFRYRYSLLCYQPPHEQAQRKNEVVGVYCVLPVKPLPAIKLRFYHPSSVC